MPDVWVTYKPPDECQCWRDALCAHGWTWQETIRPDGILDRVCAHAEWFDPVFVSLGDAVRNVFSLSGAAAIGCLLRDRGLGGNVHKTREVYVMPPGVPLIDDHDAEESPAPLVVISRVALVARSAPQRDPDRVRAIAESYRQDAARAHPTNAKLKSVR